MKTRNSCGTALKLLIEHINKCDTGKYTTSPFSDAHWKEYFIGEKGHTVNTFNISKYLTRYTSTSKDQKARNPEDLLKIAHYALMEAERVINKHNEQQQKDTPKE